MSYSHHNEQHYIQRTGWLRAAVLGANDGTISVTSLIIGMAAGSSALAFSLGALFPMFSILISPEHYVSTVVMIVGILSLAGLGALSGHFAGTSKVKGSLRVTVWGIIAMAFAAWIGSLFNMQLV